MLGCSNRGFRRIRKRKLLLSIEWRSTSKSVRWPSKKWPNSSPPGKRKSWDWLKKSAKDSLKSEDCVKPRLKPSTMPRGTKINQFKRRLKRRKRSRTHTKSAVWRSLCKIRTNTRSNATRNLKRSSLTNGLVANIPTTHSYPSTLFVSLSRLKPKRKTLTSQMKIRRSLRDSPSSQSSTLSLPKSLKGPRRSKEPVICTMTRWLDQLVKSRLSTKRWWRKPKKVEWNEFNRNQSTRRIWITRASSTISRPSAKF